MPLQHLALEQALRERLDHRFLLPHECHRALVRLVHEIANLLVDHPRGVLRVRLLELLVVRREGEQANLLVHAVDGDAVVRHLGHLLQVVLRAGADLTEHHLLRGPATQGHAHHVRQLLRRGEEIFVGKVLRKAERRGAARDDGHLEQGFRVLEEPPDDGVPGLVVRHGVSFNLVDDLVLLLEAGDDAIGGGFKVREGHRLVIRPRRDERRLVDDVGDVRAAEPRGERGEPLAVMADRRVELDLLQVHLEDLIAALDVGAVYVDLPVESTRAEQRAVQDVRTVGTGQYHHALLAPEPVHLHEELVQRVLALVVAAHHAAAAALATDGVNLVYEDDAR